MNQYISISKKHITWVDSLKGIAIIMVVLLHVGFGRKEFFAWYYIGQSVPLFLFCTAFLLGNRNTKTMYEWSHLWKTIKRIFLPFFICTIVQVVLLWLINTYVIKDHNVDAFYFIKRFVFSGGYGPGSYYPWMYIQFWLFIPIIKYINDRCKNFYKSFFITACLCAIMELAFFFVADNFFEKSAQSIWSFSCIRYCMIIWIGINFNRILEKKFFCILAVVCSVIAATIDIYFYDLHSYMWNGCHWFTMFYIIVIILFFRRFDYPILRTIGKYSWDIFLIQMAYFSIMSLSGFSKLAVHIGIHDFQFPLFILFSIGSIAVTSFILIKIKEKKAIASIEK